MDDTLCNRLLKNMEFNSQLLISDHPEKSLMGVRFDVRQQLNPYLGVFCILSKKRFCHEGPKTRRKQLTESLPLGTDALVAIDSGLPGQGT